MINPNEFFFFILTGATWCYHAIYIVFTYFASFTGYKDDILKVISNLQVQESKFGGKIYKFGGKSFKKLNSAEFMELVFSKSVPPPWILERVRLKSCGQRLISLNGCKFFCLPKMIRFVKKKKKLFIIFRFFQFFFGGGDL